MSTNFYWQAFPKEPPPVQYCSDIKRIMARRYWDHDGTLFGAVTTLGESDVPFLSGVAAATPHREVREAAEEMIKAIREQGGVSIWING